MKSLVHHMRACTYILASNIIILLLVIIILLHTKRDRMHVSRMHTYILEVLLHYFLICIL